MKKTLLIILFAVIAGVASAQPIKLGVKAGMSFNSVDVSSVEDAFSKIKSKDVGLTMGLVSRFSIPFTGMFAQPELVYNHSRYKVTNASGDKFNISYNNIELPVLVGLNLLFVRLNAGPVFNIATFESGSNNYNIKRPDLGYVAGFGLSFAKFDLDLRWQGYFRGKKKHFTVDRPDQNLRVNNTFVTLSASYFF